MEPDRDRDSLNMTSAYRLIFLFPQFVAVVRTIYQPKMPALDVLGLRIDNQQSTKAYCFLSLFTFIKALCHFTSYPTLRSASLYTNLMAIRV